MKTKKRKMWFMKISMASDDKEMLHTFYRVVRDNHADVDVRVVQRVTQNLGALIKLVDEVQS
jgi:hypothetical protein